MSDNAALATDLALLSEALQDPDVDLAVEVRLLAAHTGAAVASYLGLSLTVDTMPTPFRLRLMAVTEPAPAARSSLRFPVPGPDGEPTAVTVTLFAATPGAFVDLGADLAFMFGLDLGDVVLDRHLELPAAGDDGTDLADLSVINQAVGVLIARGAPSSDSAYDRLVASAEVEGVSVGAAAATVLESAAAVHHRCRRDDHHDPGIVTGTGDDVGNPPG